MKVLAPRCASSLFAIALFGVSACAYAVEAPCSGSECDVPDPITLDPPVVRCWMEPGRSSESELHCSYAPSEVAPVRIAASQIEVSSAGGINSTTLVEASEDLVLARFDQEDFPVDLTVDLVYGDQPKEVIGIDTLGHNTQHFYFDAPQAADKAEAAEVRLPFSLWELTLHNRYQRSVRLRFKHGLPFEPAGHIAEADIDCYQFGFQTKRFLAVPRGAESLDGALRVDDIVSAVDLEGPGSYLVDEDGSFSKIDTGTARGGYNTANCWIDEGASTPYQLSCSANPHPGLAAVTVDVRSANGAFAVLPLGGEISTQGLSEDAFPLELAFRSKLSGDIYGLSSFGDSPHREVLQIARPQDTSDARPLLAHLPFDLWRLEVVADTKVRDLGIEFQPFELELGTPWLDRFALRTFRQPMLGLSPGETSEAIVAVSPGQRGIPVVAYVIDQAGARHQEEFLISNRRYRASAAGIGKAQP